MLSKLLLAGLLLLPAVAQADYPVKLDVNPKFSFAPSTLTAKIRIQPNVLNVGLCIAFENDEDFFRSSCWGLNGQYAPVETLYTLKDAPAGEYQVSARLTVGHEAYDTRPVTVQVVRNN